MAKQKVSLGLRIKHMFTYHPLLKMIALIMAIITWIYVRGEINRFN
ncbi:MAG: hypothetical protein WAW67_06740 [Candidatus Omnitrophota bacterium]